MLDRLKGLIRARLVRNILALYGVRVVNQLLPLVVIPYLARVLGPIPLNPHGQQPPCPGKFRDPLLDGQRLSEDHRGTLGLIFDPVDEHAEVLAKRIEGLELVVKLHLQRAAGTQ